MNWIFFAAVAGLSSAASNFLHRVLLKEGDDSTAYAWFFEVFRSLCFGILVFFNFSIRTDTKSLLTLLSLGLLEFFSIYFYMKMHAYSYLSISSIISRSRVIWVPIIAFILLGEALKVSQYAGIMILFLGLSLISAPHKIINDKGIKYAYLSAIGIAGNNVLMKASTSIASNSVLMLFMSIPSIFLFPLVIKNPKERLISTFKNNLPIKIIAGIVNTLSMYFLILALKGGSASTVTAIYQAMAITSVLLGIIFLKETQDVGKKIIGTVVTLGGVLLLTAI